MTEEHAVGLWRDLAPIQASVIRRHQLAAGDPDVYEVHVVANDMTIHQVAQINTLATAAGVASRIEKRGEDIIVALFTDPVVVPAVQPK